MAQSLLDMHEKSGRQRDELHNWLVMRLRLFLRAVDENVMRQAASTFLCDGVLACQTMLPAILARKEDVDSGRTGIDSG